MNLRLSLRVALLIAELLPDNCEALIGDILEEHQSGRSDGWLWRQVVWAALARAVASLKRPHGVVATVGNASASLAILVVVAFEIVIAATLLDRLSPLVSFAWAAEAADSPWSAALRAASFPVAFGVAWLLAGLSRSNPLVVTALAGATIATAMAFLLIHVAHPTAPRPFLPSASVQLGAAAAFVFGLLTGSRFSLGGLDGYQNAYGRPSHETRS